MPGRYLCGFFTPPVAGAAFRAALVASCFRGALPPVDFLAVCFVLAIIDTSGDCYCSKSDTTAQEPPSNCPRKRSSPTLVCDRHFQLSPLLILQLMMRTVSNFAVCGECLFIIRLEYPSRSLKNTRPHQAVFRPLGDIDGACTAVKVFTTKLRGRPT